MAESQTMDGRIRGVLRASLFLGVALILSACSLCLAESDKGDADYAALKADAEIAFKEGVGPFVKEYCTRCHGNRRSKGAINFEAALTLPGGATSSQQWKKAVANVKAHDMPPVDAAKIPTDEERQQFIEWIGKLKYLSPKDPGPFVIRRLTKVEYGNTLSHLFGVDASIAADLPEEVFGQGYLNSLSPLQSELFLGIANKVLSGILAVGDKTPNMLQKRLFGERPPDGADLREAARQVAGSLARDAFRRPPSEAELDILVQVFDLGRDNELDYPSALGLMLKAILVSPQFLFITPAGELDLEDRIAPLDDYQLASRLSYLLWLAPPDAELSVLAGLGMLHEREILRAQVRRLLMDPRSRGLFDGFGVQWLGLGELESQTFDPDRFPQITQEMRSAMMEEARLFFESIVRENQSVVRFVDNDYTFLNGTLAKLYGLETSVKGLEMRRVKLTNLNRGGILGMPGPLASTSFPNRTSPVRRGVWVLEQVLGEQIPPPPADVPELEEQDQKSVEGLTLRQRTELHQTDPTCANCHKVLDPIGFGLENFDAIGRWREEDEAGGAIDAAGELPGGEAFTSPKELKKLIAKNEAKLARNLTERLMAYALCRQLEGYDEIVLDQVMERIAKDNYRVQTLITEIVTSYLFTQRRIKD
jgi:mono/diheme cytochrome c family protein